MRALAVDPSKSTGVAHGLLGTKPKAETILLAGNDGVRFCTLETRIRHILEANEIERIFMERVFINPRIFSMDHTLQACGYQAAVRMACEKTGLGNAVVLVSAAEWRSAMNLPTQAPKHIKGMSSRRKWLKDQSIGLCLEYGWAPKNSDEADAMLIWAYCESLSEPKRQPLQSMVTL